MNARSGGVAAPADDFRVDPAARSVLADFGRRLAPRFAALAEAFQGMLDGGARDLPEHLGGLFSQPGSAEHDRWCQSMGQKCREAGLAPSRIVAAYASLLSDLGRLADELHAWRGGKRRQVLSAVTAAVMRDLDRVLSAYHASGAQGGSGIVGGSLTAFASALMDRSVEVAIAINDASIANAQMVQKLRDVDVEAQAIAAATEETVTGVREISARSQDVHVFAREAHQATENGRQVVASAVSRMDQIANAVREAAQRVSELSGASERIADIVSSIEAIAGQTNLLALNATIEAARAGEAGKGFAVVATEVKNLANQTARATEDIRTRIEALRSEMAVIVQSMEDGTRAVASGQEAVAGVDETMRSISSQIEHATERMAEIASILTQQTAAANEVSEGVTRIATRSSENSQAIMRNVEATKGVENLLGNQLKELFEHDIPNKVVKIAKVDHVMWKKRLADMVVGLQTLRPDELTSHEACRLGKWYYGPASMPYREYPAFKALEAPHRAVHQHGVAAAGKFNQQDLDGALREIAEVEKASAQVVALLDELAKAAEAGSLPQASGGF